MWVFGYGSLMWSFDFPFEQTRSGYIKGYDRRFYQYSTDHRGTPEKPGRVVTVVPSDNPESRVYGLAYKVKEGDIPYALKMLDQRERGGYKKVTMTFYPQSNEAEPVEILVYVADEHNPQYAGPADVDQIVADVLNSSGPSGTNIEYVKNLAASVRNLAPGVNDEHLFTVESKITEHLRNYMHISRKV